MIIHTTLYAYITQVKDSNWYDNEPLVDEGDMTFIKSITAFRLKRDVKIAFDES